MKVVLDTNVIISAFLWAGQSSGVLDLIEEQKITIFSCAEQIFELEGVLTRSKFKQIFLQTGLDPTEVVETFVNVANLVELVNRVHFIKEDPADNIILSCAMMAQTEFIVTGDQHLLSLKEFRGIKIVKLRQFLEKF